MTRADGKLEEEPIGSKCCTHLCVEEYMYIGNKYYYRSTTDGYKTQTGRFE